MHPPDARAHAALEALWRSGGACGVALSLTTPDLYISSGSVTEVVAASYERVTLATDATGFAAAVDRAIETIVASTFPDPIEDWGVCLSLVFYDTDVKATGDIIDALTFAGDGISILAGGTALVVEAGAIRFTA